MRAVTLTLTLMFTSCTMPGKSFTGPLPPVTPAQTTLADELRRDVTTLAKDIGDRNLKHPEALSKAVD